MDNDESIDDLRARAAGDDSEAALELGNHYAEREEWAQAEEQYRRALELGNLEAHYGLGQVLHEQGQTEDAETHLRAALAAGDTRAAIGLGNLLSEREGSEALEEAETLYRQALTEGDEAVLLNYANLLAHWPGRQDEAEQMYRDCIKAGYTDAHNNLGMLLSEMGREQEAEAEFRQGIAAGDPWAWYGLGMLLRDQDRLPEAEEAFKTAIAGGRAAARGALIDVYLAQDRAEDAEREYHAAIEAGDDEMRTELGVLYQNLGRFEEAEQQFRGAIAAGIPGAYIDLGNLYDELRRPADAEEQYRLGMASGAPLPSAAYNLAVCLGRQGREEEALEGYRTAAYLGFKPARWTLADLAWRADPAHDGVEVWAGLVTVAPEPGNDIFEGAAGAVTNVCALARDEAEYRRAVEEKLRDMRLIVQEIEGAEPFSRIAPDLDPDAEIFETAARVSESRPVVYTTFYMYESDDD